MHQRKTSKEEAEDQELDSVPPLQTESLPKSPSRTPSPLHTRTTSAPNGPSYGVRIPSSPSRNYPVRAPSLGAPPSAPSSRQSFAGLAPPLMNRHARAPSVYEPLYGNPPSAPPTKSSFSPTSPTKAPASPWRTAFPATPSSGSSTSPNSGQPSGRRGHGRVHSRNLSVYFPRPGQTSAGGVESIAEDADGDGQEIEFGNGHAGDAPIQLIPPPNANAPKAFGDGFKFGGLPMDANAPSASGGGGKRRGHHHKHSLSHNFFSFMEPGGSNGSQVIPNLKSPVPESPWAPVTPFPQSATFPQTASTLAPSISLTPDPPRRARSPLHAPRSGSYAYFQDLPPGSKQALLFGVLEFIIGGMVWVAGQRRGSLACAGLGYWVVFDAMGVAMGVVGREIAMGGNVGETVGRPFGSIRLETTLMFAQSVYLMFAAVYTCKETVEHLLLAAGSSHHHHTGDEEAYTLEGLLFPNTLLMAATLCMLFTAFVFATHERLVTATGPDLPTLSSLSAHFRSSRTSGKSSRPHSHYDSRSKFVKFLDNPFCIAPVVFAITLLGISAFVNSSEHRSLDLALAGIETLVTWAIAYPTASALGRVLLQTAPESGMEGLQRAVRELERHPQIIRPPVPKVWQLTPGSALVATMELHIRHGVDDAEVLALTRYAYERCVAAVGRGGGPGGVSISVVRG